MTDLRTLLADMRAACGDGTTWADVDEKRGPMAVITPEAVLALLDIASAAERAANRAEGSAQALRGIPAYMPMHDSFQRTADELRRPLARLDALARRVRA